MKLNGIRITWLGHATFRLQTPKGKTILVDPWVMGNPVCPANEKEVNAVDDVAESEVGEVHGRSG